MIQLQVTWYDVSLAVGSSSEAIQQQFGSSQRQQLSNSQQLSSSLTVYSCWIQLNVQKSLIRKQLQQKKVSPQLNATKTTYTLSITRYLNPSWTQEKHKNTLKKTMVALWSPEFACVLQKARLPGKASTQLNIDISFKKDRLCRLPVSHDIPVFQFIPKFILH